MRFSGDDAKKAWNLKPFCLCVTVYHSRSSRAKGLESNKNLWITRIVHEITLLDRINYCSEFCFGLTVFSLLFNSRNWITGSCQLNWKKRPHGHKRVLISWRKYVWNLHVPFIFVQRNSTIIAIMESWHMKSASQMCSLIWNTQYVIVLSFSHRKCEVFNSPILDKNRHILLMCNELHCMK